MTFPQGKPFFNFNQETHMITHFKRMSIVAGALLSTLVIAAPASADTMLSTGGYSREFQKMGMMKMLDDNGDHMVSSTEFTGYFGLVFDELDTSGDGTLDAKEWVGAKGNQEISLATGGFSRELRTMKMMGMMDADGDHKVTKDEFIKHHDKVFKTMAHGNSAIDPQNWLRRITNN
jgi:hypothetical protein